MVMITDLCGTQKRIFGAMVIVLYGCSTTTTGTDNSKEELPSEPVVTIESIKSVPFVPEGLLNDLRDRLFLLENSLVYLESDAGKKYYIDGACTAEPLPERQHQPYPEDACGEEVDRIPVIQKHCQVSKNCDLVSALILQDKLKPEWDFISGLGCSFSGEEQTLLTNSTTTMTSAFCAVGTGKIKNKYINIFRLGRSAACAYSLQNIVKRSDKLASCMSREVGRCTALHENWLQNDSQAEENHALKNTILENDISSCKASTEILSDLDNRSINSVKREIDSIKLAIREIEAKTS